MACYHTRVAAALIDWSRIDTVLLDMDGTLLDLRFDNWFWQELIPRRYAAANGLSAREAWLELEPKYRAARGTIQWYCIDYWTEVLALDIAGIKRAALEKIGYLPGAEDFLRQLKAGGKRCVLITNAHPVTLAIKNERVGLMAHFDACYSTHPFGAPKEHADFWPRLQAAEPFNVERTLMVDDSLPVLEAAQRFGIGWLRAIRRPDSGQPAQHTGQFSAVDCVGELLRHAPWRSLSD
jgi:putative hydrolase of the HAD superfamily